MSFKWQMKCLGERLKDKFLKGKSIHFKFNEYVSFNIDSRTLESFETFSNKSPEAKHEIDNFIALTKDKTCLLDIGAHHGVFSLVFTSHCSNSRYTKRAYAFDPSPRVFNFLAFNAKVNPDCNIKAYQVVVGDNNEPVTMKFESVNQLSAIGDKESVKKHHQIVVESITIDQFIDKNQIKPDVIKIDTEGFEYQVLGGGRNYLKNYNPLIFLEIHPPKLLNHGLSLSKLEKLLCELGYNDIYDLDGKLIKDLEKTFDYKVMAYRTVVKK